MTLDMSKLSGWLNAVANCRVERRAYVVGGICAGRLEDVGGGDGASSVQGSSTKNWIRKGVERTRNIFSMVLTLDVSKLSSWLNVDAPCAESKGEHTRCEPGDKRACWCDFG